MSDPAPTADSVSPTPIPADSKPPTSPLLQLGGLIGLVACAVGLILLLAGCAGKKWFALSPYIVYSAAGGLLISLLAAAIHRRRIGEETHVLLALFTNAIAIVGGLMIMAVWKGWALFPK